MSDTKIRLTLHALERMKQRGITRKDVFMCLNSPDKSFEDDELRKCVKKVNNNKAFVIVYRVNANGEVIIITAFKTSKVRKYFRE